MRNSGGLGCTRNTLARDPGGLVALTSAEEPVVGASFMRIVHSARSIWCPARCSAGSWSWWQSQTGGTGKQPPLVAEIEDVDAGDAPLLEAEGGGQAGNVNERPHFVAVHLYSASAEGQVPASRR